MSAEQFVIEADAVYLQGHFPGNPVVPGVVILDRVLEAIGRRFARMATLRAIPTVKFISPLLPGEILSIDLDRADDPRAVRFRCGVAQRRIAEGTMVMIARDDE